MANTVLSSRDPVCGMEVKFSDSRHSATYGKRVFHFCSAQCLSRFRDDRLLADSIQSMPIRRKLRLLDADPAAAERAREKLAHMMGVASVSLAKDRLIVAYDIAQVTLARIEAVAASERLAFRDGVHGLRRRWWNFIEKNALANAAYPTSENCCSHAPEPKLSAAAEKRSCC